MPAISSLSEQMHWLRLLVEQALLRVAEPAQRLLQRPAGLRQPRSVHPMPQPLHACSVQAADICRGLWRLAGHEVRATGNIIFDHHDAPADWLRALHGFDWIFALLRQEHPLWLLRARTLLLDWMERDRRHLPPIALTPELAARRLINWSAAATVLLHDADTAFRNRFLQALATQYRQVQRPVAPTLAAPARLRVYLARAWGALALLDDLSSRNHALEELAAEMSRQFLPDGGHVSRSPAVLLQLMGILLPLAQAAENMGLALPAPARQVIDRAVPMLRMFAHADDGLALFQAGRETHRRLLGQVLAHDAIAGAPLDHAPHSGYARLQQASTVAIVDVGTPATPLSNPSAALSPLALEFSARGQRIITSCGAPWRAMPELDMAARLSAAHSLPQVAEEDAGELRESGLAARLTGQPVASGPSVEAQVRGSREGMLLEAAHGAWLATHGLRTRRSLFLSADGNDLRGEDAFLPAAPDAARPEEAATPFTIRFHLHPSVRASMARDGLSVMLLLPDRSAWVFTARNARMELEESILLAGRRGPRRSSQIVLRGQCGQHGCQVNWRLRRSEARPDKHRPRRKADDGATLTLPLQE